MKVELITYMHDDNGISLEIIPEGEIERKILALFFKSGKLEINAGKFYINSLRKDNAKSS